MTHKELKIRELKYSILVKFIIGFVLITGMLIMFIGIVGN